MLVIDHHVTNTRFGTVNLVDERAAATAVVVVELLDRMGLPVTAEIAAPLYTGLITDTGSFKYAATTPAVHELAARLLATGIRHDVISREIWDTAPFAYVQLLGAVCSRSVLEPAEVGGLGLVWTTVVTDDLDRFGLALSDVEGVIDVVRTAGEAEVAAVLKTDPADGLLKVSMRSKGQIDVGAVCVALGGGGHRFAAGFTSYDDGRHDPGRLRPALAAAPHLPDVTAPDGLVVVDKPAGWTSHDVVGRTRRLARTRKVGHAGTLDPMATGVLLLGIGKATRLLGHLALTDKAYDATIRLGVTTVTDDAEGDVLEVRDASGVTEEVLHAQIALLTGSLQQVPSSVSAVKVDGVRSYARVRAGEDVELKARESP